MVRTLLRPSPDVVAHDEEVMWHVTDAGWLYIVLDTQQTGSGTVAMAAPDIDQATSALHARGVVTGPIKLEGDAGRKA